MKKLAFAAMAFLLLLSGCKDKETTTPGKDVKEINTVEQNEKKAHPFTFPLTGITSETRKEARAIAVMINNHPKARPQSGLYKADIVYEILAEGEITRFLAVFQSEMPEKIGPVRSARDYYIELAKGLDALYIAHGYSPEAKEMLQKGYIDNLNGIVYDGTLFKRSSSRKAPHNSYITYGNILKGAKQKNYSMSQTPPSFTFMSEEDSKKIRGRVANSVKISYSNHSSSNAIYKFDASLGKYKRYSGGEQTVDLETNEPILVDNIFIVEATHRVIDSKGRREIDLQSGGRAYLLQMGKVREVEWGNDNGVIIPVKNGEKVAFVQGKTWVNIVPTKPGLEKSVSFHSN